jgi:hypothetical protein
MNIKKFAIQKFLISGIKKMIAGLVNIVKNISVSDPRFADASNVDMYSRIMK